MLITRDERNLLVRVGKHLRDEIEAEERGTGSTPLRDRLLRDERDLRALRKRLEAGQLELGAAYSSTHGEPPASGPAGHEERVTVKGGANG